MALDEVAGCHTMLTEPIQAVNQLCRLALRLAEDHAWKHNIDTSIMRFELLSLQHEVEFVESIQALNAGTMATDSLAEQPLRTALEITRKELHSLSEFPSMALVSGDIRTTDNTQKTTVVDMAVASSRLRAARLKISDAHKDWLSMADPWSLPFTGLPVPKDLTQFPEASRFFRAPFAMQQDQCHLDQFPRGLPEHFADVMSTLGQRWIETTIDSERSGFSPLSKAQLALFQHMWVYTTRIIRDSALGWELPAQSRDFERFEVLHDQLDQHLRDALLRQTNSSYSMVFISTESSGKSTFLNALIGKPVLPTGRKSHTVFYPYN